MHTPPRLPLRWLVPLACLEQLATCAGAAHAQPPRAPRCDDPRVTIDATLKDAWRKAAVAACAALQDVPDTDPGVRMRVTQRAGTVVVEATLADGRRADRQVAAPGDLRLTLEALAVTPPPDQPLPVASSAPPAPPPPVKPAPPALQVGLGLWLSGRAAGMPGYVSIGPTLSADVGFGPWFVGLVGRWEAYQTLMSGAVSDFTMQTAGAGLLGGRRVFERASARLDLGLFVVVLAQTQSFSFQQGEEEEDSPIKRDGSAADARLGLFARAAFGASALRWLVAIDAELSPFQIDGRARVDPVAPALPGWSVGLATGIGFGTHLPWSVQ